MALALVSCADLRARQATTSECTTCHGDGVSPAPPTDLAGLSATERRGVGAHAAHLEGSTLGTPIPCETCHVVPENVYDAGHLDTTADQRDTPADVTFSGLALVGNSEPEYDTKDVRCAGTWCHARSGGDHPEPVWTRVDGAQIGCDGCHGFPPPAPHPTVEDCSVCHPGVGSDGALTDAADHINGQVDLLDLECNSCHGRDEDGAPPPSLSGTTETTDRSVGAHLAHLEPEGPARAVPCEACHVVPEKLDDAGHRDDDLPAEVTFGDIASNDDLSPDWNGTTCANTYCHGTTLRDGSNTAPEWTLVDGTQRQCTSCHGLPPGGDHPVWNRCHACHPTVDENLNIIDADAHVDGEITLYDFEELGCDGCHGMGGTANPPPSLDGSTDTTTRAVGAHEAHLSDTSMAGAIDCDQCHIVPTNLLDAGHVDSALPAEVTFGDIATDNGKLEPSWDGTTCSNTYCHGATLLGSTLTTPTWTVVDGTQAACGACHGLPPPSLPLPAAQHPAPALTCSDCHPTASGPDTIVEPCFHVDGRVSFDEEATCP